MHLQNEVSINFQKITSNGIRLHTALAGPEGGEPVFLLHGFPDAWFGWEAQIDPLADAGFRVIVPDQRGYNLSDKFLPDFQFARRDCKVEMSPKFSQFPSKK